MTKGYGLNVANATWKSLLANEFLHPAFTAAHEPDHIHPVNHAGQLDMVSSHNKRAAGDRFTVEIEDVIVV